jgi:hypothetical protein
LIHKPVYSTKFHGDYRVTAFEPISHQCYIFNVKKTRNK